MNRVLFFAISLPLFLQAASYTASQSGDPTSAATWGGTGVPGYGDTWNANNYTLTLPPGKSWNTGTCHAAFSSATLDGEIGPTGALIINGVMNARGNFRFDGLNSAATHNYWTIGSGATVATDCSAGANTTFFPQASGYYTVINFGISGTPWSRSWSSGGTNFRVTSTGTNGITLWHDQGALYSNLTGVINGGVIDHCGTATQACIDYLPGNEYGLGPASLAVYNTSWQSSGVALSVGGAWASIDPAASWDIEGNSASGGVDAYSDLYIFCTPGWSPTGTKKLANNVGFRLYGPAGSGYSSTSSLASMDVRFNVFADWHGWSSPRQAETDTWSFSDNLVIMRTCNQSDWGFYPLGTAVRTYLLCVGTVDPSTGISGHADVLVTSQGGGSLGAYDWGCLYCVMDVQDAAQPTGYSNHGIIPGQIGGDVSFTGTVDHMLVTANNTVTPYRYPSAHGAALDVPGSTVTAGMVITHYSSPGNVMPVTAGPGDSPVSAVYLGETGLVAANNPWTWKFNMYGCSGYSCSSPIVTNYLPASQPANIIPPLNVDWNWLWGQTPVTRWTSALNPACNPCSSNGTYYDYATTGATPGQHDTHADPLWVESTRDAYRWASLRGQSANSSGVISVFLANGTANASATMQSLFGYVRAGFFPANASSWNADPDNSTPGAVEAVWQNGGMMRRSI